MLLIDDLLLSPISGFKFILRTLARAAEEQYTDDAPIKERLLELQTLLEEGSISEDEYVEQEREVLAELREIQNRRMQMAGITPEEAERMGRPMLEIPVQLRQEPEDDR
jgi:cytochrome c-type biogenesis protein CcmH/NrfG